MIVICITIEQVVDRFTSVRKWKYFYEHTDASINVLPPHYSWPQPSSNADDNDLQILRDNMHQTFAYMTQCPECDGILPKHKDDCALIKAMKEDL